MSDSTPAAASTSPADAAAAPSFQILVEDYFQAQQAQAQITRHRARGGRHEPTEAPTSSSAASAQPDWSRWITVRASESVPDIVRRYRALTQRHALLDPVVFLAHTATAAAASAVTTEAGSTAAAANSSEAPTTATEVKPPAAGPRSLPPLVSRAQPTPLPATPLPAAQVPALPQPPPPQQSHGLESGLDLLQRVRGKRVLLSSSVLRSSTLGSLGCRSGSVLTLRSRPFPLRFEVDNSALLAAGVPACDVDRHSTIVYTEEGMSVRQLRDEYVRQVRENPQILGCDRHRLFLAPNLAPLDTSISEAASFGPPPCLGQTVAPPDAIEVTFPEARCVHSLPLRGGTTVWVRKDPTRWLGDAIRAGDEARAEKLIALGADAHLLDATGRSGFFYAMELAQRLEREADSARQGRPRSRDVLDYRGMSRLLQRHFLPSPLESQAVRQLQAHYAYWLSSGACIQKQTAQWVGPGDIREFEDYAFVHAPLTDEASLSRKITNERHKIVGEINLRKGAAVLAKYRIVPSDMAHTIAQVPAPPAKLAVLSSSTTTGAAVTSKDETQQTQTQGATSSPPLTARKFLAGIEVVPVASAAATAVTAAAVVSASASASASGAAVVPSSSTLWPSYDRTPDHLLFDLDVLQPDHAAPQRLLLRSPQFPRPDSERRMVHTLKSVQPLRVLVTRVETFKNIYMINLKLIMLLVSAAGAIYSFLLNTAPASTTSQYGIGAEIDATFALTVLKALVAFGFLGRIAWPLRSLSFPRIKAHLLAAGNEVSQAESWVYFLCLEVADAAMIVCNVRVLASLSAGGVALSIRDLDPRALASTPLTEGQSMFLSIFLSFLSLIGLNLLDTFVSFLADESRSVATKAQRYFALHLIVLVHGFAALRLAYDFRWMQVVSSEAGVGRSALGEFFTPVTLSFMLSYVCGLALKGLHLLFLPPMNHALMDEMLSAHAISVDMKSSLAYVLLSFVVFGAEQHPQGSVDRALVSQRQENGWFVAALAGYFASGLVLCITGLAPFVLNVLDKQVVWAPPIMAAAARKIKARVVGERRSGGAAVAPDSSGGVEPVNPVLARIDSARSIEVAQALSDAQQRPQNQDLTDVATLEK